MKRVKLSTLIIMAILCAGLLLSCGKEKKDPIDLGEGEAGNWIFEVINDERTNKWQPTGGISTINFEESATLTDDADPPRPLRVPKEADMITLEDVLDAEGNPIKAYHFEGTVQQRSGLTSANYHESAGWPQVGWAAKPADEATWELFKSAYAYSFWIRVNKSYKTYQTSVDNTIYLPKDEGFEPLHWFGTTTGVDAFAGVNYTNVPVGEWTKVTVIYDPDYEDDYNMDHAKWIYSYGIQGDGAGTPPLPNPKFPGIADPTSLKFDKETMVNIKWQIQLQHNGGVQAPKNMEYMQGSSSVPHEFSVDFYGLELHLPE